jgi:hypothetical protein
MDYIASMLPRLRQYSKNLNDTALLADHPWVFIDDEDPAHLF